MVTTHTSQSAERFAEIPEAFINPHKLSSTILREYDIRGTVGKDLSREDAYAIGLSFGYLVKEVGGFHVCVGRDGRHSSPALSKALIAGLTQVGITVTDIGLCPTPMVYFADRALNTHGAIMVTGSHNPPDQNGFKMVWQHKPFFGKQIQRLGAVAASGIFHKSLSKLESLDISQAYCYRMLESCKILKEPKVAWDPGNGAAGEILEKLLPLLPGEHILINAKIDGDFPSHHPDPTVPENLEQLTQKILENNCDYGFAFDGDGDRVGVVDNKGQILWGDQLLALLAEELLESSPGATIIADVKASQVLFDHVEAKGGNPLMWKTGHSLIKNKITSTGALLAGEMSGHIFFADSYYGFDDAIYAAIRLMNCFESRGKRVSELRDGLPKVLNTPELRFPCEEDQKFGFIERIKAYVEKKRFEYSDVDGVRVKCHDGWWLLRASNTQAVLVARCEAPDEKRLELVKNHLRTSLRKCEIPMPPDFH
ncbi:phosphoglucomutase/phosphomannomutase PgmG [Kiloniella sp. EL199]|uniref:phosphoglucomutase/phosphomannomutase PgmG n=1 Tax=Kiloniella sp. EL199 TaxID=2107581 RepID=UPI000EA2E74F|nr:phosphomannomutase/phosphoglucomutase [Kiloniella sp. EL199]